MVLLTLMLLAPFVSHFSFLPTKAPSSTATATLGGLRARFSDGLQSYSAATEDYFSGNVSTPQYKNPEATTLFGKEDTAYADVKGARKSEMIVFQLLSPEDSDLCLAASGKKICLKAKPCDVLSHKKVAIKQEGYYLTWGTKAYPLPYLPVELADASQAFQDQLNSGQPLQKEKAMAIIAEIKRASELNIDEEDEEERSFKRESSDDERSPLRNTDELVNELAARTPYSTRKKLKMTLPSMKTFSEPGLTEAVDAIEKQLASGVDVIGGVQADIKINAALIGEVPENRTDLWSAFLDVEELLQKDRSDLEACKTKLGQVAGLTSSVQALADTANTNAQEAVVTARQASSTLRRNFTMGAGGPLDEMVSRIKAHDSDNRELHSNLNQVVTYMELLVSRVDTLDSSPFVMGQDSTMPSNDVQSQLAVLKAKVEGVQQEIRGGGFKTGAGDFSSEAETMVFCKAEAPAFL